MTQLVDAITSLIRQAAHVNRGSQKSPAAVLWPDKDGVWLPAISVLRAELPQLLTLGAYDPSLRQGPAIWLKVAITGRLDGVSWSKGDVPVIYLPGVSRTDLRAIESCPRELQPLAELQYRGVMWGQYNGKDWTIASLLASDHGGLGLSLSLDKATQEALSGALLEGVLLSQKLEPLQARALDSAWANSLISANPVRDLLTWLNQPEQTKEQWGKTRFNLFEKRCKQDYGFSPSADGELAAAEKLLACQGSWLAVWQQFVDSWRSFSGVFAQLARVPLPKNADMFTDLSQYPEHNVQQEWALEQALLALQNCTPSSARERVLALEEEHGQRHRNIWADMDKAPLAKALVHLLFVARETARLPAGTTLDQLQKAYTSEFWQVDDAALRALAQVRTQPAMQAVETALATIYKPWLDESAKRLQEVAHAQAGLNDGVPKASYVADGSCYVFIDGLRYDVARRLEQRLKALGDVVLSSQWTCVPSVTASGKAWVSPVAHKIIGLPHDQDFEPSVIADESGLSTQKLRKLLADDGFQVLKENDLGDASGKAWVECGDLDHYGHQHGLRLARDIDTQLDVIVERLDALAAHGWVTFHIVTDHGWLLVPGDMPKVHLDKHSTETRWGRCAVLKNDSTAQVYALGWDWCPDVHIAMAPGIGSFIAGMTYAHGGISFQESLVPQLKMVCKQQALAKVDSLTHQWRHLVCQIEISPAEPSWTIDLRRKAADSNSSLLLKPKPVRAEEVTLMVEDDDAEGDSAVLVVLGANGEVIAKYPTLVGGK